MMLQMNRSRYIMWLSLVIALFLCLSGTAEAKAKRKGKGKTKAKARTACFVGSRSTMVIDMSNGNTLLERNPDARIAPASITKVLTLYLVFEAMREGAVQASDLVPISHKAANSTGSRMHVREGQMVPLEEIIKGIAVVSGNDACIAVAEYISGSTEAFVRRMNRKAKEIGMENTHFENPNGLPADGQCTTARDIAKLSLAYLQRFPDSLTLHSMRSYTFNQITHRNANRLLGKCPGVDGLKTGFVCSAGYNITVTAKRGNVRILVVVMGAPTPGARAAEAEKLVELGFKTLGQETPDIKVVQETSTMQVASDDESSSPTPAGGSCRLVKKIKVVKLTKASGKTRTPHASASKTVKSRSGKKTARSTAHAPSARSASAPAKSRATSVKIAKAHDPSKQAAEKSSCPAPKARKATKEVKASKASTAKSEKAGNARKTSAVQTGGKPSHRDKSKQSVTPAKKSGTVQKSKS